MDNTIAIIPIEKLIDFEAQPFKVLEDETMSELVESIKEVGVLSPVIVRRKEDKYEIISGHRRKRACEKAGVEKIPAFIKELDDDEAAILLVDSNLQRENLLPSEKAYAYKLKLAAIKHQGEKTTCGQNVHKLKSRDIIGEQIGKSGRQIQRYLRLTELIDQLLEKVDNKRISIISGSEISYLNVKSQIMLDNKLNEWDSGLTTKQAYIIKKTYLQNNLNEDFLENLLSDSQLKEETKNFNYNRLKSYFPKDYSKSDCEKALWEILDKWFEQ